MKVLEVFKKDSSKFVKTLRADLGEFHWQDGYGLFGVSPSHFECGATIHPRTRGTSPEGNLPGRIPPASQEIRSGVRRAIPMGSSCDLGCPFRASHTSLPAHRGRCPRLQWMQPFKLPRSLALQ
jgi:hypothetical protein